MDCGRFDLRVMRQLGELQHLDAGAQLAQAVEHLDPGDRVLQAPGQGEGAGPVADRAVPALGEAFALGICT